MTDRPIIFSAPMVRALLAGRKTQTRRLMKLPRAPMHLGEWEVSTIGGAGVFDDAGRPVPERPCAWHTRSGDVVSPAQLVGDQLYVREAWRADRAYDDLKPSEFGGEEGVRYEADGGFGAWTFGPRTIGRYRHSRFMPRWASRLTLIVEEVSVEPLQAISRDDAIAEGLTGLSKDGKLVKYGIPDREGLPGSDDDGWHWQEWKVDPTAAYARLWSSLHTKPGERWEDNPMVVALTFRVEQRNIDAGEGA